MFQKVGVYQCDTCRCIGTCIYQFKVSCQEGKIVENPGKSGIDLESPLYLFTAPQFPYAAIVGKIKDEGDLTTTLNFLVKEQMCEPIAESNGFKFTVLSRDLVAFNESTLFIVNNIDNSQLEATKTAIAQLFKQTKDQSIDQIGAFKKMSKLNNDINFFSSLEAVPQEYRQQISMGLPAEINLKDVSLVGGLNFDKGKIDFSGEYYTENKAVKELLKKQ